MGYRHPEVQRLRRLTGRRRVRQSERVFVVEGATLVSEAISAGARVRSVYLGPGAPSGLADRAAAMGARVLQLAPGVIERVSSTVSPQPAMAVVGTLDVELATLAEATLVIVGVDVSDPGNAGTMLRSAEAAGVDAVVFCGHSVDVYNPKTVRASAGALFHVPLVVDGSDPTALLAGLKTLGLRRLGTYAGSGLDYAGVDLTGPVAIVLGNEAAGLRPELAPEVDERVTIPMAGRSESINVGMAAAVLCFEAARQRRVRG